MSAITKKSLILLILFFSSFAKGQSTLPWKALQSEFVSLTDEYLEINPEASGVMAYVNIPNYSTWHYNPGYKGIDKKERLTGAEPFIAASITKMFMATCILQLEEEGILSLEDKATKYIDEAIIKKLTLYKGKSHEDELTIKHLLNHTSGFFDYLNNGEVHLDGYKNNPLKTYTLQERLSFALDKGSANTKIGKYHYSNTNYILLGMIAEDIENQNIATIIQERIITPLGLKNTSLQPQSDIRPTMFKGYYTDWDLTAFTLEFNKMNPAGGILTTVHDLNVFARAVFKGNLFKSKSTLSKLLNFKKGYGLGVMLFEDSRKVGRVMGHSGFDPGYTSYLIYLEDLDATVVTVINQSELRVKMPAFLVVKIVASIKEGL